MLQQFAPNILRPLAGASATSSKITHEIMHGLDVLCVIYQYAEL